MTQRVFLQFPQEALRQLEEQDRVRAHCDLVIETWRECDDCRQTHHFYLVTTSTGKYQGRYEEDPYYLVTNALREDGWLGPCQAWRCGGDCLGIASVRRETWIRLRAGYEPGEPQGDRTPEARNLAGADLRTAALPQDLRGANLQGAILDRVDLRGRDFKGANLYRASAIGANLTHCRLDLADLRWADLRLANLAEISMTGAILDGARLQGAHLQLARATGASFRRASLRGASLYRIQARSASFENADLSYADLRGAVLLNADLTGTDVTEADLIGAWLWP